MSQLRAYLDGDLFWKSGTSDRSLQIKDPKVVDQFRRVPTLSFTLPPTNAGHGEANPITSRVTVYEDSDIIFHGRPLTVARTFDRQEKIVCENALGFMADPYIYFTSGYGAPQPPDGHEIYHLFNYILNGYPRDTTLRGYNNVCDSGNEISLGTCTEDPARGSASIYGSSKGRSHLNLVWELVDQYGLAVWVSWEENNGVVSSSLNFAEQALIASDPYSAADDQKIIFGQNLVSLDEDVDATGVFTKIRGYDTTNNVWFTYAVDAHVAAYGDIMIGKDFDTSGYSEGAAGREDLARMYYEQNAYPIVTRSVKALDSVDLGASVNRFRVGFYYDVVSAPHGINERMMCQKITRYLDDPSRSSYEFGQVKRTLTGILAK